MSRDRGRVVTLVVGACLTAVLVAVPSAQAAVTASQITTPKDLTYAVYEYNHPSTIAVSGTSNGTTGDNVDVLCYWGTYSTPVASNVSVAANGTFSDPAVSLENATHNSLPCQLRAVPTGTTPANATAFAGPRLLVDVNRKFTMSGGPNNGKPYDYYVYFQQPAAGYDYYSLSSCGVCDGYLADPSFTTADETFFANAGLFYFTDGPIVRSELQIDGANAYGSYTAHQINADGAGLPRVTYSYTLDKKTGDGVIHESEPLVKCADPAYPPTTTSCATFVPTGVTATVTMNQDHSGRVAWVSDVFKSTDGKRHKLDLLWDNNQRFFGNTGDPSQLEYKFPGQSGYSTHVVSDTVKIAAGPGTILIRMHGAPDGDKATARGAIVYDRTAAQAKFRNLNQNEETFVLHQSATVPAHGSTRFRFAYVQDFEQATVDKLAKTAATVFAGCTVPNVVHKTLAKAKKALKAAHCTVGKITYSASGTIAAGTVVYEAPAAGTHVDYGAKVALIVIKG